MKKLKLSILIFLISIFSACSGYQKPLGVITAKDGTQYIVLKEQNMIWYDKSMFVITYISANPQSEKIRNKEFEDLYRFFANNLSSESKYEYIALIAATKPNKKFGITTDITYRDRRLISEVMKLRDNP